MTFPEAIGAGSSPTAAEDQWMHVPEYWSTEAAASAVRHAAIVGCVCVLPAIVAMVMALHFLLRVGALVTQYGFGKVPPELFPERMPGAEWFMIAAHVVAGICFVYGATRARRELDELRVKDLQWSAGFLPWSILVPFVNLYRPWVGIGETDRALRDIASPAAAPGTRHFTDTFSLSAACVCGSYLVLAAGGKIIDAIVSRTETAFGTPGMTIDRYLSIETNCTVALLLAYLLWTAASVAFLLQQSSRLRFIAARDKAARV